ncbi:MAG: HAMP domain-containing histidine kinase [Thermoleophilaceae bacterium]|nr:HAMP domain-containing histidine kinase [Thermoleophilaceae bacterium]
MSRLATLPVRWRLAITSAGLTFAILLLFAVVVGVFTSKRLHGNFDDELKLAAADIAEHVNVYPYQGAIELGESPDLIDAAATGHAAIRIVSLNGGPIYSVPQQAPDLGPPAAGTHDASGYRVVSRPIYYRGSDQPIAFLQYARPRESVENTIDRMQLFLALGVVGGTLLALLAGLTVAERAMEPIARLTSTAKRIARTRDPAVRIPIPAADDEVADLARTLDQMLRALDESRAETEAALARQREFVADASHELRTPLTSILTNLELLEDELEGERREIARSALRSSRRMRGLVADLLLLARADAGQRAARRPTDLAQVVREAAVEVAPVAPDHELSVDARDAALVEGSPDELHRLVLNLLHNATVHTPAGTQVRASVQRRDGTVVLEVADDGPGVPEELGKRVFERFVRGEGDSAASRRRGTGLGLAIVQAVAEGHGGSVELADSERGARFVVRLPATEAPAPPGAEERAVASEPA